MSWLQSNGNRIFYSMAGRGFPLVLLHGFTGRSEEWQEHRAVFAGQFQVITIDLPGHGRSESPADPSRYQMAAAAAIIIDLLNELGIGQSALLGYSMGGRLALYTAVHYPGRISTLILESASPGLAGKEERFQRKLADTALAAQIERDGISSFVKYWESLSLWQSQEQVPKETRLALHQRRLRNNPIGLANSLRGMGTGVQPSLWPRLREINVPVLLMAGAIDTKFVRINRQMAVNISSAKLEIVAKAGHTIHLERPSAFQNLVLSFLV